MKNLIKNFLFSYLFIFNAISSNHMLDQRDERKISFSPTINLSEKPGLDTEDQDKLKLSYAKHLYVDETFLSLKDKEIIGQLTSLKTLSLVNCGLGNNDLVYFLSLPKLKTLNISYNQFDTKFLASINKVSNVKSLICWGNTIGSHGLEKIRTLMPNLNDLNIEACKLEDDALDILQTFPKLNKLIIKRNNFSKSGLYDFLIKKPESLKIFY